MVIFLKVVLSIITKIITGVSLLLITSATILVSASLTASSYFTVIVELITNWVVSCLIQSGLSEDTVHISTVTISPAALEQTCVRTVFFRRLNHHANVVGLQLFDSEHLAYSSDYPPKGKAAGISYFLQVVVISGAR